MEPHREKPKAPKPRPEEKQKRFRIVKLEERIAPSNPGGGGSGGCDTHRCVSKVITCGWASYSIE